VSQTYKTYRNNTECCFHFWVDYPFKDFKVLNRKTYLMLITIEIVMEALRHYIFFSFKEKI